MSDRLQELEMAMAELLDVHQKLTFAIEDAEDGKCARASVLSARNALGAILARASKP